MSRLENPPHQPANPDSLAADPPAGSASPEKAARRWWWSRQTSADAGRTDAGHPASGEDGSAADRPGLPGVPADLPLDRWSGDGQFLSAMPSWLASLIIHMLVLVIMAVVTIHVRQATFLEELTFGTAEADSQAPDFAAQLEAVEIPAAKMDHAAVDVAEPVAEIPQISDTPVLQRIGSMASVTPMEDIQIPGAELGGNLSAINVQQALRGRTGAEKLRLLREGGGTLGSEEAVKRALVWLKNHQNRDGSWSFVFLNGACSCPDKGELRDAYIGATAMGLLPFLGAGYTHLQGMYRQEVQAGLYYLIARQQSNGSLWEPGGQMYSHGLASIVLCEAYAMTGDKTLAQPAQAALNFISYAQDPVGGGWRYVPHEPGDTSVVGWQLMALKSGHMSYLQINPATLQGAWRFLDSVQTDDGSGYGYQAPGDKPSTTAIGLLCRMYMGWGREQPALMAGVERLSRSGRSDVDMYYNYYATQVMRHYGGEPWEKWNAAMRDWLVESQAKAGHQTGSWHMGNNDSASLGGRLYSTSMATMILEVYYRHMPIYQSQAADEAFEF